VEERERERERERESGGKLSKGLRVLVDQR